LQNDNNTLQLTTASVSLRIFYSPQSDFMFFNGLINYRYAPNDWSHDVVTAVWCIRSFCESKVLHSYHNNSGRPFYQTNCKNIMV